MAAEKAKRFAKYKNTSKDGSNANTGSNRSPTVSVEPTKTFDSISEEKESSDCDGSEEDSYESINTSQHSIKSDMDYFDVIKFSKAKE